MTPDGLSGVLTVTVRVKDFPPLDFLAGTTGLDFFSVTNTATGLGTVTVLVEVDDLDDCELDFLIVDTTGFFSDPLLIVTLPVVSNLRSAGVKKEIVPDCLSGVLIVTLRSKSRAEDVLSTLVTGLETLRVVVCVVFTTSLGDESPDLLIVTLPVASNRWSAGVKKEIVPDCLSGVLMDTVRDSERAPWLLALEEEALCAEACCAAAWAANRAAAWADALAAALAADLAAASACLLKAASSASLAAAVLLVDVVDDVLEDDAELDELETLLDPSLLMVTLPVASNM